jgi:hypothetical protein
MSLIDWLLGGDAAIRWQVLRDLTNAPAGDVAAERARVEHDGWGARLLALEDPDGPTYLEFAFPYYWHYDVLRALDYFRNSGADPDPRMAEAVAVVRSRRQPDGRWLLDRIHPGRVHFHLEGGAGTPSRWNTLRALRVLNWWDRIA